MDLKIFAFLLIILSLSFASDWLYPDASGKVCFNVTSDGYMYGSLANTYYEAPIIQIYNNNSFTDNSMRLSYYSSSLPLYKLYDNGNYSYLIFNAMNNTPIASKEPFCIYSGGNDFRSVTPFSSYLYDSSGMTRVMSKLEYSNSLSGVGVTTSWCGQSLFGMGGYSNTIDVICNSTSCDSNSIGNISNKYVIAKYDYYTNHYGNCDHYPTIVFPYGSREFLLSHTNQSIIYSNYTANVINYGDIISIDTGSSNAVVDWSIRSSISVLGQNYSLVGATSYDFRDMNIHIVSPAWGGSYTVNDVIPYIITYSSTYDNCSLTLNSVNILNITTVTSATTTTGYLYNSLIGSNDLKMSCYKGGNETHNYATYYVSSVGVENVFVQGLGVDVGAVCSGSVITALSGCNEYYKLYTSSNFGAVVCKGLNLSMNYSCIGTSSFTKNNYTIFYTPSYWIYPTGMEMQHMGATFYYNSLKLSGGIELLPNNQFIYLPAQNKSRDCGIYYLSTNYCSWGGISVGDDGGVILNNGSIYIADKSNTWFTTAGLGLDIYNENISQIVVNEVVVPVNQGGKISDFGFYTRTSCIVSNDSFNVNIQNTMVRNFVITVLGNNSYSFSFNSSALNIIVPLNGTTYVTIYDGSQTLCEYDGSTTIFLPAIFRLPFDEGFGGFFPKVILLMTVVLSTIIPYALFGTFIFNDLYHVIPLSYVGVLTIFAVIGGLVNNIQQFERGIKHMILLLAIVVAYIVTLAPLQTSFHFDISVYTSLMNDFRNIMFATDLYSFSLGIFTFIVDLFLKLIFLPVTLIGLIYDLMLIISPTLFTSFVSFKSYLECGAMLYFYLKSYEVIANRFRIV